MSEQEPRTILFVGAGTMGAPMIRRLAGAGHNVLVKDADPVTAASVAADSGARVVGDDISSAELVILMLPSSDVVDAALGDLDDPTSLAAALGEGVILLDMGSSEPDRTRAWSQRFAERQVTLLDAPVSGGPRRAETGELAIMVGADSDAAIEFVAPVLAVLGVAVFRTGSVGSAHALKALNNLLSIVGLVGALECLTIGRRFGLDPQVMLEVINASTGRNHATEVKVGPNVLGGAWNVGFTLDLTVKDVRTALSLATRDEIPARVSEAAADVAARALDFLGSGSDQSEIARYIETESRVTLG